MTAGCGRSPVLLDEAVTARVWLSLAAPEPIPLRETVCSPAFVARVRLASAFKVGASFTAVTVMATVATAELACPSLTRKVKLSEPL